MRGLIPYILTGILVILALDFIGPPLGLTMTVGAWPAIDQMQTAQSVVLAHKGDRLSPPITVGKPQDVKSRATLVGCDPVFSPLSASAQANFAGRCLA
jgi:hypothetical protein